MARTPRAVSTGNAFALAEEVADAAAKSYRMSGLTVFVDRDSPVKAGEIFIPELNRVELVETDGSLGSVRLTRIQELKRLGIDVWVLAPLASMGAAHRTLAGAVDRIQPWWVVEDKVQFGEPRIA